MDATLRGQQGQVLSYTTLNAARRTIARIAFLSVSERDGQALVKRVRARSCVARASDAPVALDCTLPESEMWLFPEENNFGSTPLGGTVDIRAVPQGFAIDCIKPWFSRAFCVSCETAQFLVAACCD